MGSVFFDKYKVWKTRIELVASLFSVKRTTNVHGVVTVFFLDLLNIVWTSILSNQDK
jgi:hypothetical protein